MPRTCLGSTALSAGGCGAWTRSRRGGGGGAGGGWPEVGPPPQPAALAPTSETSSPTAWSITAARRLSAGRCRWPAAPTAPRAFPGPRSPCGLLEFAGQALVLPTQPGGLPLHRVGRGRPCGAASATSAPRSRCLRHSEISEVSRPRGAAARPCRPCPAAGTHPGSRPCSEPHRSLAEPLGTSGSGRCWLSIPSACTPDITVLLMVVATGKISLPALSTQ